MKVLHLLYESEQDPFGFGGAAIRTYKIYEHLRKHHQILLVCRKYPGARDRRIRGLDHHFVGRASADFTEALLHYAWQARRFVRHHGEDFDVIVEEFSPATPMFLQGYGKRPLLLQIQGFTGLQYVHKYPFHIGFPLLLLERVRPFFYRRVVHVSRATAARFRHRPGCRQTVIANGIDRSLLALEPDEENYILYLGRLDIHHKGIDVLLAAFARIAPVHPRLRLQLVGDGRDRQACLALLRRLPLDARRRVDFRGWLDGAAKAQALANAALVVVPSRYETEGIVVLEAAACGKPVLVSDIEALEYLVKAGGAVSFRCGDAVDLAIQITRLLAAPRRRRERPDYRRRRSRHDHRRARERHHDRRPRRRRLRLSPRSRRR